MRGAPLTTATGLGPLPAMLENCESRKAVKKVFAAEGVPLAVVSNRQHRIPLYRFANLFRGAARHAGSERFGLDVGLEMPPGDYGLWARYAGQAPTLGSAISRIVQTLHVHQTETAMRIAPRPNGHMAWEYWHPDLSRELFRQHTDHVVPVMVRFVRAYLGPMWRPTCVEVGYTKPLHAADLEAATSTPWMFGRHCMAIRMPSAALKAKLPAVAKQPVDGPVLTYSDVLAEKSLEAQFNSNDDVAAVVALRLLDGLSDIDGAARMLGTSCRTLQRQLEESGITYRALLTSIRMRRAESLIAETGKPLKKIGADLGYSDPAHFTRAFTRHFGYSPSRLRRRLLRC
jgi:AraC-like DNA-binding protein